MFGSIGRRVSSHRHPANIRHYEQRTFGERLADTACAGFGSWSYIIVQAIAVFVWVCFNVAGWIFHWDPYPFILLNLAFSFQASFRGAYDLIVTESYGGTRSSCGRGRLSSQCI